MGIGIYTDLAVGSQHGGFDTWIAPQLFARDVNLGAPPDALGPDGQDWGLCPLIPQAQRQDGYRFVRALLQNNMRHSGALRIDHAIGLARQYWVPHQKQTPGAYVAFPLHEWLGVIALESAHHRCIVIGEDLGTVPAGLREALTRHGLYGCRVMHFDIDAPAHAKRDERTTVLATLNSHDLAPFAAFLSGDDLRLRQRLGLMNEDQVALAQTEREERIERWVKTLHERGVLPTQTTATDTRAVLAATHRVLSETRCELIAYSLDDLVGETTPLNVPGVTSEPGYEPWTRKMSVALEAIVASTPAVVPS
jgi:4-alpha-glucanotransferase